MHSLCWMHSAHCVGFLSGIRPTVLGGAGLAPDAPGACCLRRLSKVAVCVCVRVRARVARVSDAVAGQQGRFGARTTA